MSIYYKVLRDEVLQLYFIVSFFWGELKRNPKMGEYPPPPRKTGNSPRSQIGESPPRWVTHPKPTNEWCSPKRIPTCTTVMHPSFREVRLPYRAPKLSGLPSMWTVQPPRLVTLPQNALYSSKYAVCPQMAVPVQNASLKCVMLTQNKQCAPKWMMFPKKEGCSPK